MKTYGFHLLFILQMASAVSIAQRLKRSDKQVIANLRLHVAYLADDKLEGRRAGSDGEKLAREYISQQFKKYGLQPKGDSGSWFQPFRIYDGKQVLPSSHFIINGNDLKLYRDYFPFPFSASKRTEAAVAIALSENGVPWFMDLKELQEEHQDNPHFSMEDAVRSKADHAASRGATALIIYNSSKKEDLRFSAGDRSETADIPVLYVNKDAGKKYFSDESASMDINIKVELGEKHRTGYNVIGYLNEGASNTVVLGAHYDHLGYGEDGNSLSKPSSSKMIHNGADDNASGTAALIEMARLLKQSGKKGSNYLFIAFSGEESGLYGSKYFTENPSVDLTQVNYMINMDMIGRLNDSSKVLTIGGYGTSPAWGPLFSSVGNKYFSVRYDSSGTGPSDHTSFYRKDIPVLFFFTGLHADYHKPGDDLNKINFTGEFHIVRYIMNIIEMALLQGKIAFVKTREQQMGTQARFSVTLGIMPDYTFAGNGVRVDGISNGRPADKAGIQAGDVILELAGFETSSLESYMQALSNFKKGEKASVKYKRGNELMNSEVEF